MRVKIAAVVMAHPSRAAYAEALKRRLGRGVRIVYDPEPDAARNPWRAARAAWEEIATTRAITHGLVVQEDVIPCREFLWHAKLALQARPSRITSFYLGDQPAVTARDQLVAVQRCASWVLGHPSSWVPALALAIPIDLVESLVDYDDGSEPVADDEVYGRWTRLHRLPWYATIPSLVDHDDDAPSLMRDPYARGARRASCYVGNVDPHRIDWTID